MKKKKKAEDTDDKTITRLSRVKKGRRTDAKLYHVCVTCNNLVSSDWSSINLMAHLLLATHITWREYYSKNNSI